MPLLTSPGTHKYPLHLLNLASVQDLDSKIAKDKDLQQLDARRFRSNIISQFHPSTYLPTSIWPAQPPPH